MSSDIQILGIRTNNLKNIDVTLKKGGINLIIGPSGSGKSSLAYETIAQIGQHELFSMFADEVSEPMYKVKEYRNMIATVPIKQLNHNSNLRSTIGTYFGLNSIIILLYSSLLELSEDFFVLNKAENLCEHCHGLGFKKELDENRIIDYNVPLKKNPFKCWNRYRDFYVEIIKLFCAENKIDSDKTFRELSKNEKFILLYGESKEKYNIKYKKTNGLSRRTTKYYGVMTGTPMILKYSHSKQYFADLECPYCCGRKYSPEHNEHKILELSIGEFMVTPFNMLIDYVNKLKSDNMDEGLLIALNKVELFIEKAIELGLGHLFFHRSIPTLSGGELQRLRLVQVFNSQLADLLLVLDEPLAGLSGLERSVVYNNILELSTKHTLVIVEHSDIFVKDAKMIVALGEKSGKYGGNIIDVENFLMSQKILKATINGTNEKKIAIKLDNKVYKYHGVNLTIAENCLNLITGKSGVGKSTFLREYLPQFFESYEYINQKPLLGNKNSSVATALDIFSDILNIFATKCNKEKRFFYNYIEGDGACSKCGGIGFLEYGDVMKVKLICKECDGTGFNAKLKKYKVCNKTIFDIWDMTIDEAVDYFERVDKKIVKILSAASEVLLGHLKIGQPTATLSGGENIRIKILKSSKTAKRYLGIDEPFKGLGNLEIDRFIQYFCGLIKGGKTLIIVEHNEEAFDYFPIKIELYEKSSILMGNIK
ncbi:MAG: transporter related protein [Neobacillus sp.]|jgi:excinuclease UvrABC ATPase subunit|nr:transporter related protein [Neobacillus sp.]